MNFKNRVVSRVFIARNSQVKVIKKKILYRDMTTACELLASRFSSLSAYQPTPLPLLEFTVG